MGGVSHDRVVVTNRNIYLEPLAKQSLAFPSWLVRPVLTQPATRAPHLILFENS